MGFWSQVCRFENSRVGNDGNVELFGDLDSLQSLGLERKEGKLNLNGRNGMNGVGPLKSGWMDFRDTNVLLDGKMSVNKPAALSQYSRHNSRQSNPRFSKSQGWPWSPRWSWWDRLGRPGLEKQRLVWLIDVSPIRQLD